MFKVDVTLCKHDYCELSSTEYCKKKEMVTHALAEKMEVLATRLYLILKKAMPLGTSTSSKLL